MTPDDWIEHVHDEVHRMSADLVLTGQATLTTRFCMVCGKDAVMAFAVLEPRLHYKWKPCGHILELE